MRQIMPLFLVLLVAFSNAQQNSTDMKSIHQFSVENISGDQFDLSSLKGKKVLIVNTASECGLTPQYEQLEELYQEFKDQNFTIVGFPANNFGAQEPGSPDEIQTFCKKCNVSGIL